MAVVKRGAAVPELTRELERRRELGQDLFDEVWEGVYWMVPGPRPSHGVVGAQLSVLLNPMAVTAGLIAVGPFNLGESDDYRVPDHSFHRSVPTEMYVSTAAIVVEVISPGDRTWEKFGFYAAHGVDELVLADPGARTVQLFARRTDGQGYDEVPHSALLGVTAADLTDGITWP